MLIRKFDPAQLVDAYDVKEQMFYPCSEVPATPFGSAWLVVEPGRRTKPHNHHEGETFFILRGRGTMTVGDEVRPVESGDVIYLPPFGDHILENESRHEDLHFLTIWWEDAAAVAGLKEQTGARPARRRIVAVADRAAAFDAEVHARYARLCGGDARTLVEGAEPAGEADAAAVLDLFARLQRAGEVVLRSQPTPGLYFDPAPHAQAIARHAARATLSPRLQTLVDAALGPGRQGLGELAISQLEADSELAVSQAGKEGLELPLPGLPAHRFAPRFARAARLLALAPAGAPDASFTSAAPATPELVVFVDRGEARFHAVWLPALAAAAASAYAPAAVVEAGEGAAALADLAAGGRDGVPGDWLDWLRGLEDKVARKHQGSAPPTQAWTFGQQLFVGRLQRQIAEAAAAYQAPTYAPRRAARLLRELVAAARELAEREEPWSRAGTRREESSTAVAVELLAAKVLALLAHPLLPEWSARVWHGLGYTSHLGAGDGGAPGGWEDTPTFVPTGHPIRGLDGMPAAPARSPRENRRTSGRARRG